jgi:hypothetical protein
MDERDVILKVTTNGTGQIFIEDEEGEILSMLEAPQEDEDSVRVFARKLGRDIQMAYLQLDNRVM